MMLTAMSTVDASSTVKLVVTSEGHRLVLTANAPWYHWGAAPKRIDSLREWQRMLEGSIEELRNFSMVPVPATASFPVAAVDAPLHAAASPPEGPHETPQAAAALVPAPVPPPLTVIDLNAAELEALPGIGSSKATAIVMHRQRHGPFERVEDLEAVVGIGPGTVARLAGRAHCGDMVRASGGGASMGAAQIWEETLSALERGKAADESGDASLAVRLLTEGVAGLELLLTKEGDMRRLELLRSRREEFSVRLKELRAAGSHSLMSGAAPHTLEPPQAHVALPPLGVHTVLFFPDARLPCPRYLRGEACTYPRCKLAHRATNLTRLLALISGTRRSLDVAVYNLSFGLLADALRDAHERGVSVRIICDDEEARAHGEQIQMLRNAGVSVRLDASKTCRMHHKFMVVDGGEWLLTGSFNFTAGASTGNYENLVLCRGDVGGLARRFAAEFERLWTAFGMGKPGKAPSGHFEAETAVLFFPEDGHSNVALILAELERARESIDLAMFTLTHNGLADALISQHLRGRRVRVITDNRQSKCKGADAMRLREAGVPVRTDSSFYAMHHKFCVVDGDTVLNGSLNWTVQATTGNQENVVIYRRARTGLASPFASEFDRLWSMFA
jgi:competence ComEA-like helix-hairpin-helix protein